MMWPTHRQWSRKGYKIRSIFCTLPVWRNGRRVRLKIEYSQGCGGSSPLSGTMKEKIIVICGPTATGKSDYAVTRAKQIGGEIVSADSRQVYRGLDIGSGKITKKEMRGVRHHLLDVVSPKRTCSVTQYQTLADKAIRDILKRNKVPIICGGTGFYIDSVVYGQNFPVVKPNTALRKKLEKFSTEQLAQQLGVLDPKRFETIDTKNKVRLIRAIEIAKSLGSVPKVTRISKYVVEWHYLDFPDDVLKQRIHDRLFKRMKSGMVREVQRLHDSGVSWKRLEALGLEYRYIAQYLQNKPFDTAQDKPFDTAQDKLSKSDMLEKLEKEIWNYAKRQRTWFKKYGK